MFYFLGEVKDNFSYNSRITEVIDDKNDSLCDSECSQPESNTDCNKSKPEHCGNIEQTNPKRPKLDVKPRTVVNYICELVAVPGKMNVRKALELGVPSGPLLGKLQKGQDVTLENGTVVRR